MVPKKKGGWVVDTFVLEIPLSATAYTNYVICSYIDWNNLFKTVKLIWVNYKPAIM